jgi:Holliday junction resolvase-like predicted endonuclease
MEPFESITAAKRNKVIAAAKGYMAQKGRFLGGGREIVFDVVSILFNGDLFEIKYIREAFAPLW